MLAFVSECEGMTGPPIITRTGHGVPALADAAAELARQPPPADGIADDMVTHHSWDVRAAQYDPVFAAAREIALPFRAAAPATGA
jgi:hypothetical protein